MGGRLAISVRDQRARTSRDCSSVSRSATCSRAPTAAAILASRVVNSSRERGESSASSGSGSLERQTSSTTIKAAFLQGMGGIGKTVLAQALCRDEVVQQTFPDGVVWITIGKESAFDTVTRMREVGKALGDDLSRYENELAAKNQYRSTIRANKVYEPKAAWKLERAIPGEQMGNPKVGLSLDS